MAEDEGVFQFQLDSEVSVYDEEALLGWIVEQVSKIPTKYDCVKGWRDPLVNADRKQQHLTSSPR
jgi:hypothetical protein